MGEFVTFMIVFGGAGLAGAGLAMGTLWLWDRIRAKRKQKALKDPFFESVTLLAHFDSAEPEPKTRLSTTKESWGDL